MGRSSKVTNRIETGKVLEGYKQHRRRERSWKVTNKKLGLERSWKVTNRMGG